jgi:LPXTG-site transpeptidase (sortase) family protein
MSLAGAYFGAVYFGSRNLDRLIFQTGQGDRDSDQRMLSDLLPGTDAAGSSGVLPAPPPHAQVLYPGSLIPGRRWANPRADLDLGQEAIRLGFTPVQTMGAAVTMGIASNATRLSIPAVNIDVQVQELAVVDLQDSRAYETPNQVVGHIPDTNNPGTLGNGWYFGHLESPLRGEGNVFGRLIEIPELLEAGEDVYVITESNDRRYLYLVTETDLVHQDDLRIYETDDSRVTLVTCYPRLKYDHRLVVTAKLVGFKDLAPQPSS